MAADLDPFSSSGLRDQGSGWIRARPWKRLAREAALRKGDRAINLRVLRPSIKRKPHESRRLAPRRAPVSGAPKPVAIIMGSQSDWAVMRRAAETLEALGVGYEALIVSAHRTPDRLVAFAKGAKSSRLQGRYRGGGRSRASAGHDGGLHHASGVRRSGPLEGAVGPGQPPLHRPNAGRRSGRHARDRRSGRGQRRAPGVRRACARRSRRSAVRLEAWRAERTAEVAERPSDEAQGR